MSGSPSWIDVCPLDRLAIDRGVAALVGADLVAVFRLAGDELYAIDHVEPFTRVPVLARGLVGSVGETPTVASPLHKQRFDLRTGACLDEPDASVRTWSVRVAGDMVQVAVSPTNGGPATGNGHYRRNGQAGVDREASAAVPGSPRASSR